MPWRKRIAGDLPDPVGNIDVLQSDGGRPARDADGPQRDGRMECLGRFRARAASDPRHRLSGPASCGRAGCRWTCRFPKSGSRPRSRAASNGAVHSVVESLASAAKAGHPASLSRAVKLIYGVSTARVWRRPTRCWPGSRIPRCAGWRWPGAGSSADLALEFRDHGPDGVAEARAFADDALRAMSDHPVVLALASRIKLNIENDLDQARYLALRARPSFRT